MRKILLLAGAAALGIALGGSAQAQIKIAVAGPITGDLASFGSQMVSGAQLAVEDINAAGGVLGKQIELVQGDDQCDPKQATAVAGKLAGDGVKFVAGHFCSGSSIPASAIYAEEQIIQISPASTNPKFTDERPGPGVYRVCGRDDQQGGIAGQFLAKHFKDKKIAIVDDKSAYGKGLADETRKALNKAGVTEAANESINAGEKDYSALVTKLKGQGIDVLYLGGYHPEAGLIKRQMVEQGMATLLISGDALVTNEYWSITGPAGNGTLMTFSPDPRRNPEAAAVVKRFEAKNIVPEGYVLYTYAAIQAWAAAATEAGSTDFDPVNAVLAARKFKTVLGELGFDKKGDVTLPGYVMYEWKDGKYDYTSM